MKYLQKDEFFKLQEIINYAKMENADFGEHSNLIKEQTKLFRETWIIAPLTLILTNVLKREIEAKHKQIEKTIERLSKEREDHTPQGEEQTNNEKTNKQTDTKEQKSQQ